PVNEAADTAFRLEDRAGVKLAPIVVNGMWPHLDLPVDAAGHLRRAALGLGEPEIEALGRAAEFRRLRQELKEAQVARRAEMLPLPQLTLPYLFETELGRPDVAALAAALAPQL